ncbi:MULTISPECIES: DUF3742 family protein [Pseudomonadota]|uniref:DUF3742 family protein n=3 Tax=Lysobacterales TaxID=135614 RepID=A0ABS8LLN9_XANEU|nr:MULTISPECIES: DUF3742 family protein [Pseudomonadota]ABM41605.1 conserved hypothetical protein [Acidovorax sp. JS42]AOY65892.1 hypothetical protein BHE83_04490 [Xanthomonas euvesicatoria pv. vesicatoria str. 85-10]AQQ19657.1 hypothetical protein A8D61_14765 [Burkholderia cenocepacia]KLB39147.1 signal peptide protein [Xanthomonas euvesicatoria]MCC8581107.1 DUF3742 family protein [Xanthomonas euvesicatoria pv. euvesicatoria]
MNTTTTRISTAERLGRAFGRGWRAYARGERRVSNWLASKGMPLAAAAVLVWMVKLAALGVLLYTAFWLALLLLFVMVVAWMARNADSGEALPEPEWRNGPAGFGLYTYDGFRIDPHVEDD